MKKYLLLFLCLFFGAAAGALLRGQIVAACCGFAFPLGILLANMLGSFLLGLYYSTPHDKNSYQTICIATAFLGSLTTFSAFIHDIFLIGAAYAAPHAHFSPQFAAYLAGHPFSALHGLHALLNLFLNVVLCLVCVYLGKKRGFIRSREKKP